MADNERCAEGRRAVGSMVAVVSLAISISEEMKREKGRKEKSSMKERKHKDDFCGRWWLCSFCCW